MSSPFPPAAAAAASAVPSPASALPLPPGAAMHTRIEDLAAMLIGTLTLALGVHFFGSAGLVTSGTAGIAFLLHYASGWGFAPLFFLVNLPFYALAWRRMGPAFTGKTFATVGLLTAWSALLPQVLDFAVLQPLFAAAMGGVLSGIGFLVLFRHNASLGGLTVVSIYLQETRGWRAGYIQMGTDAAILAAALWTTSPGRVGYSIVGSLLLNLVVAMNHKPGRYSVAFRRRSPR